MSSPKNLEYKKTSFLSKSNSSFIEEMYIKYIEKDPSLPASWENYFNTLNEDLNLITKEIEGPIWIRSKRKKIQKKLDKELNLDKSISEAYRVLKKGGRFLCLEFSKVENSNLNFLYEEYSKLIPMIGKVVIGDKDPYKYLVKSIKEFVNQKELIEIMKKNKFKNCKYRNLSGGIVAIHSGWKL